jgi:hypothetical protein
MKNIKLLTRVAEMERERYKSSGNYSVTDIINPPRIVRLKKRYKDTVEPKLESLIASMTGTAVHEYFEKMIRLWIERHDYKDYVLEKEVHIEMQGRRVSGRFDILDGLDLYDIKNCKAWKLVFDPDMEDWHEQQNLYNYLVKEDMGLDLNSLNIIAFYKDWIKGSALRDRAYPQAEVMEYQLGMWPLQRTEDFLYDKLENHIACEELPDEELPLCTREERWERHQGGETVHYGILTNSKAKRAKKVIRGGSLDAAVSVAHTLPGLTSDSVIEVRYAQPKRCVDYCEINKYCSFYQGWLQKNEEGKVNDYIRFKT